MVAVMKMMTKITQMKTMVVAVRVAIDINAAMMKKK